MKILLIVVFLPGSDLKWEKINIELETAKKLVSKELFLSSAFRDFLYFNVNSIIIHLDYPSNEFETYKQYFKYILMDNLYNEIYLIVLGKIFYGIKLIELYM